MRTYLSETRKSADEYVFYLSQKGLFVVLFTTVACGAISGFHSLVSSGTTSKQLDKETDAKPIAYGVMLLECVLAILTICAINFAYQNGIKSGATAIFAGGISKMVASVSLFAGMENILYLQVELIGIHMHKQYLVLSQING